ncbi:MAG: caspase family protein, partial [Crocinitomicaceae bacterium]
IFEVATGKELQVLKGHTSDVESAVFSPDGRHVLTTGTDHKTILWDVATGKSLYTRLQLEGDDWLVYDEDYRFDGTPGAIEKLYFVCGLEVVELSQVKQSLRVRNLVEKILNKEDLSGYKKLSDLNICGKLPLIETIGNQDEFAYTIQRRLAPLIRIEVLLDKKVIKTIDPNTLSWSNNKATLRLNPSEIRSFFEPGKENKIKVQAVANVEGTEIPNRGVVVTVEDKREKKKPTFYGVFLGVNEYNDESLALNFPVNDALSLSKTMEEGVSALLDPQQVKVYNIHSNYSFEKKNGFGAPTLNTLRRALQEIAQKAEPQDVLFLFLAGHGTMGDNTNKKFTFLTSEATVDAPMGITTDTLFSWISTEGPFKLKANKAILILDACNSGQLLNDVAMRSDKDEEEQRQRQLDQLSDRSGLFILSAAAPNKSAYEIPKLEHGLLTYSLLRVLKQNDAIYENDNYVNMTKWFYETSRDLTKLTEEYKLKQEATPSGTGDFQLLKIDKELRKRIILAEEKQKLYLDIPENENNESDDTDLYKRIFRKIEEDQKFKTCFYLNEKLSNEGSSVKIKYSVKGKKITCRVLFLENNVKTMEKTLKGKVDNWDQLERDILSCIKVNLCNTN